MISFFQKYSGDLIYSQCGEEKILLEVLNRIDMPGKVSCEIGGHDGHYCSNTAYLIKELGWSGHFVEAEFDLWVKCAENYKEIKDRVKCTCSFATEENINAFVTDNIDIVSFDTDGGHDIRMFRAMKAKPKVVIIEINSGFRPDVEHESAEQGCSYLTTAKAALEKGYFILAHTGNLVLVDRQYRKFFPEIKGNGIENSELYFNKSWLRQTA